MLHRGHFARGARFQSTRPRGARLNFLPSLPAPNLFQSTRPRGARPCTSYPRIYAQSFNPRARVGRDFCVMYDEYLTCVSIHAPAWGATRLPIRRYASIAGFNPRARVGRDAGCAEIERYMRVSIHAPAWGATICDLIICNRLN